MVKIVESFKTQQVNLQQQNDENDDTLAAPACEYHNGWRLGPRRRWPQENLNDVIFAQAL